MMLAVTPHAATGFMGLLRSGSRHYRLCDSGNRRKRKRRKQAKAPSAARVSLWTASSFVVPRPAAGALDLFSTDNLGFSNIAAVKRHGDLRGPREARGEKATEVWALKETAGAMTAKAVMMATTSLQMAAVLAARLAVGQSKQPPNLQNKHRRHTPSVCVAFSSRAGLHASNVLSSCRWMLGTLAPRWRPEGQALSVNGSEHFVLSRFHASCSTFLGAPTGDLNMLCLIESRSPHIACEDEHVLRERARAKVHTLKPWEVGTSQTIARCECIELTIVFGLEPCPVKLVP